GTGADDVVVDVGCGTGDALRYLPEFKAYHGFDIDPEAIEFARKAAVGRPGVRYEARELTDEDLRSIQPSRVILAGLLHHLDDESAAELLGMLARTKSIKRIVTQDPVFLRRERVSNLLAWLDRGRFVRTQDGYRGLAERAGLRFDEGHVMLSDPESGRARYFVMTLSTSSP